MFGRVKQADRPKDVHLRCSFCNKSQDDVRKLIAGPTVFICDECVAVCNEIIDNDRRREGQWHEMMQSEAPAPEASYSVKCSLCSLPGVLDEMLIVEGRGFLCGGCTAAVEAAIAERRPS